AHQCAEAGPQGAAGAVHRLTGSGPGPSRSVIFLDPSGRWHGSGRLPLSAVRSPVRAAAASVLRLRLPAAPAPQRPERQRHRLPRAQPPQHRLLLQRPRHRRRGPGRAVPARRAGSGEGPHADQVELGGHGGGLRGDGLTLRLPRRHRRIRRLTPVQGLFRPSGVLDSSQPLEGMAVNDGPLIVQSDKTLLLEVDHEKADECRKAIAPFAELERAPEHVHTYRVTPLALWNARAAGHDAEQVIDALIGYSRYPVPHALLVDVAETMARYGRLRLEKHPVHGLTLTSTDRAVLEEVLRSRKIQPMLGERVDDDTVIVHP